MGGIVVGRMWLRNEAGRCRCGGTPSPPRLRRTQRCTPRLASSRPRKRARTPEREKQLHALLDNAASRGWHIMIFDSRDGLRLLYQRGQGTTSGLAEEEDPFGAIEVAAGVHDLASAYPQAHGVILDQPGETFYELAFHRGKALLELDGRMRHRLEAIGADVERVARGMAHLNERFHNLTPDLVRYHASGGMLGALNLFDLNEDALYWLRARREAARGFMRAVHAQMQRVGGKVELGGIPRTAAFSSLTGHEFGEMAEYFDYVFPKHYFWHRGNDGLYGTMARWVQQVLGLEPDPVGGRRLRRGQGLPGAGASRGADPGGHGTGVPRGVLLGVGVQRDAPSAGGHRGCEQGDRLGVDGAPSARGRAHDRPRPARHPDRLRAGRPAALPVPAGP